MTYFKDQRGRTVMHHAAEKGSMAACELILRMRRDAIYDTDKMVCGCGAQREGGRETAQYQWLALSFFRISSSLVCVTCVDELPLST